MCLFVSVWCGSLLVAVVCFCVLLCVLIVVACVLLCLCIVWLCSCAFDNKKCYLFTCDRVLVVFLLFVCGCCCLWKYVQYVDFVCLMFV